MVNEKVTQTKMIAARVNEDEFAFMHDLMAETGLSVSEIMRFWMRQARVTKYPVRPRRMLSRVTERVSDGLS